MGILKNFPGDFQCAVKVKTIELYLKQNHMKFERKKRAQETGRDKRQIEK